MGGLRIGGVVATYTLSVAIFLVAWWGFTFVFPPIFLPSPLATMRKAVEITRTGELPWNIVMSLFRILSGWALGAVVGSFLGVVMGRLPWVRSLALPVLEYFRFVPPVTLVTLFIIWFGFGEESKIVLIFYTAVFIVVVNTMAGAASVREGAIRAARSLGATGPQVLFRVVVPETVPYMVTGLQLALSNAFMTIVAAEMLAAKSGVGFMIWDAQVYTKTERMFVAFVTLSLMGFCLDRSVHALSRRMFVHYRVV